MCHLSFSKKTFPDTRFDYIPILTIGLWPVFTSQSTSYMVIKSGWKFMDNQSGSHRNHEGLTFPLNVFLIIIFISIGVICVVAYSFQVGYQMSAKYTPLVDATMEIKLEATTAHLKFEEILIGYKTEKIEDVIQHIDNAIWYANAMLDGGKNLEGHFVPLADPAMRQDLKEILGKIHIFKNMTEEKYAAMQETGVGTLIDQRYEAVFNSLLEQTDLVETKLQNTITSDLKQYRYLQSLLLIFLVLLTLFLLIVFYRYEKQRAKNLIIIREAHDQVKVLSGFLPICASCKKIRDDNGYWNQIESYIKEHSEAEFSHGICPECAQKLYPEFVKDQVDQ
jgi:hypothetical protein